MAQNSAKASSVQQVGLDNLTDVTITTPTTNQVLTYNGSGWVNSATQGDMLKSVYDADDDGVVDSAEKEVLQVRNSSGSTIAKASVVYISGATGQLPTIALADADTELTSSKTIGLTLASISNNTNGTIITSGLFHDVDTSAYADGDSLWLSSTAGGMIATAPPSKPAHSVYIGRVAYAHPTNGKIVVAIQNGYEINELHDLNITSPANNDTIVYNSGSGMWVNSPLSTFYNADGTLSGNRVVTMGGNTVNFSGGNVGINSASFNGTNPERLLVAPSNQINAIVAKGSVNSYMQLNIQNTSNGNSSSSDVVATSNNGNESTNYIDMGINGGNYGAGFIGVANDAYLYSAGRELYIGNTNTASTGNLKFFAGNSGTSIGMILTYQNKVGIGTTSPAEILDVNGKAKLSQLQVTTGATNGYVLTSDASGNATWQPSGGLIPQLSGHETFRGVQYANNSTTETTTGGITIATTGSTIARSVASTNFASKQIRKGFYASVVSTGRYTGTRGSALLWYIGGGFKYVCEFYISDTAYGSGCRQFYGMIGQTTDLTFSDTVTVDSMLNVIGVGSDAADTNLQIFHNDGSGVCTKVDLGASFPANRTAGAAMTTTYTIELYNANSGSTVIYNVTNNETGAFAEGTLSTNLPASTQGLNFNASRCMGTAITNSGQFDLSILGVYSI